MTGKGGSKHSASPIGLRAIHGAVFLGFAAIGLVSSWPELAHLVRSQSQPLHFGDPPSALAMVGALAIVGGVSALVFAWARAASAPLWSSLLILGGSALAVISLQEKAPQGRTSFAANVKLIDAGKQVQRRFVAELQQRGEVPTDTPPWAEAFAAQPSVLRSRGYGTVPYRVERVKQEGALPEVQVPGTFVLYVSPDGASFQIVAIGFDEHGRPWLLKDPNGDTVRFSGAFNPNLGTGTGNLPMGGPDNR